MMNKTMSVSIMLEGYEKRALIARAPACSMLTIFGIMVASGEKLQAARLSAANSARTARRTVSSIRSPRMASFSDSLISV